MGTRHWHHVKAVKHPMPTLVLSNSLRAAVTGYFRTLGDEVARDGVTVNTCCPATRKLIAWSDSPRRRSSARFDTRCDLRRLARSNPSRAPWTARGVRSGHCIPCIRTSGICHREAIWSTAVSGIHCSSRHQLFREIAWQVLRRQAGYGTMAKRDVGGCPGTRAQPLHAIRLGGVRGHSLLQHAEWSRSVSPA